MSILSHIEHLQHKHAEFDAMLAAEMAHPLPDFNLIRTMKKQKLLLKEEIARLTRDMMSHHSASA